MDLDIDPAADVGVPEWPSETGPYVTLVDASSKLEAELIAAWIVESTESVADPIAVFQLPPSRRRRRFSSVDLAIGERLAREDDPLCVPIRVVWLAKEIDGNGHFCKLLISSVSVQPARSTLFEDSL